MLDITVKTKVYLLRVYKSVDLLVSALWVCLFLLFCFVFGFYLLLFVFFFFLVYQCLLFTFDFSAVLRGNTERYI